MPVNLAEAQEFVRNFHRHNKPPIGHVFSLGCSDGAHLVGVAICGRPVARPLDDGQTLEVTRLCVSEAAPKGACSFLYSRAWRAAAGFSIVAVRAGSLRYPARPRVRIPDPRPERT